MTVTNSDGRSPWSGLIDRGLDRAVYNLTIDHYQSSKLKASLAVTTKEGERAVGVILRVMDRD